MIKEAGIDFVNLPDEDFDEVLGTSTGAETLSSSNGRRNGRRRLGRLQRCSPKKELENIDFCDVRGITGIKEAEIMRLAICRSRLRG